jgi:hypothetical protein
MNLLDEVAARTRFEHPLFPITLHVETLDFGILGKERGLVGGALLRASCRVPDREDPSRVIELTNVHPLSHKDLRTMTRETARAHCWTILKAMHEHEFLEWLVLDGERAKAHG